MASLFAVSSLPGIAQTQGQFEGSVTWRNLLVGPKVLESRLGESGMRDPERVFALPIEELLQQAEHGQPQLRASETTIHVRGSLLRSPSLEGGPEDYDILDLERGVGWLVAPAHKAYVKQTTAEMQAVATELYKAALEARGEKPSKPSPQPKRVVLPLRKTKQINGVAAQAYAVDADGETSIGWVTQDFPGLRWVNWRYSDYIAGILPAALDRPKTVRDALEAVGLPVRVKTLSEKPQPTYRLYEILEIRARELPAAMFQVPEDYRAVTVQELWTLQQRGNASTTKPGQPEGQ